MDQKELQIFKNILESSYEEIISKRVRNPYSHLIYYILNNVSEDQRKIYPELEKFYNDYKNQELIKQNPIIPQQLFKVNLGHTQMQASRIGLGCMGMSAFYTKSDDYSDENMVNLIGEALDQGCNFFDSAFLYGQGANERLLSQAIKKYGRDRFVIATKAPIGFPGPDGQRPKFGIQFTLGKREAIIDGCNNSLKDLGIDCIDLYYMHRMDVQTPIEETVSAFKELYDQGKIRGYGLSEVGPNTLRRAHAVFPCTVSLLDQAIQEEWSLWCRGIEVNGVLDVARELGISIVCYSPLGRFIFNFRGALTGKLEVKNLSQDDFRLMAPRFSNLSHYKSQLNLVRQISEQKKCSMGQIALNWVLQKDVFVIPGTTKSKYLKENNDALNFQLTQWEIDELNRAFAIDMQQEMRYPQMIMGMCTAETVDNKQ